MNTSILHRSHRNVKTHAEWYGYKCLYTGPLQGYNVGEGNWYNELVFAGCKSCVLVEFLKGLSTESVDLPAQRASSDMSYFSLNGNLNLMQSIWHQCRCLACLMPSFSTYNQSFPCCADFGQYQMMYLTVLCGSWLPLFVRKEEWTLQIPAKIVHSLAWETLSNWLKLVVKIDESTLILVSQSFFSRRRGHRAHQSATLVSIAG